MTVLFLDEVHEILTQRLSEAGYDCIHAENFSKEECLEWIKKTD